jgi:hypothetical protein
MKKLQDLSNFEEDFKKAEIEYNYQPLLTGKLDNYEGEFSEMTLLEIALWKTNRYPEVTPDLLDSINDLRKDYSEAKARDLLYKLVNLRGFDLPMASTVLRFAVPNELQIIDQRVYRFITNNDCFDIPHNKEEKVEVYFEYIKELKCVCQKYDIPFSKSDRILYQLDKRYNKDIRLKTSV